MEIDELIVKATDLATKAIAIDGMSPEDAISSLMQNEIPKDIAQEAVDFAIGGKKRIEYETELIKSLEGGEELVKEISEKLDEPVRNHSITIAAKALDDNADRDSIVSMICALRCPQEIAEHLVDFYMNHKDDFSNANKALFAKVTEMAAKAVVLDKMDRASAHSLLIREGFPPDMVIDVLIFMFNKLEEETKRADSPVVKDESTQNAELYVIEAFARKSKSKETIINDLISGGYDNATAESITNDVIKGYEFSLEFFLGILQKNHEIPREQLGKPLLKDLYRQGYSEKTAERLVFMASNPPSSPFVFLIFGLLCIGGAYLGHEFTSHPYISYGAGILGILILIVFLVEILPIKPPKKK